jgi:galactose mutarotase-like enzyme
LQELSEGDLERKQALREQLEKKFAAQDEVECTFKPQVNQYSSAVQSKIRITSDPSTYLQVRLSIVLLDERRCLILFCLHSAWN